MPDRLAQKLDKAAERFGVSKRDLLATLVSDHLDIEGDEIVFRPHGRGPGGHGGRGAAGRSTAGRTTDGQATDGPAGDEQPGTEESGDRPREDSPFGVPRAPWPGDFWKKRAADAWGMGSSAGEGRTDRADAPPPQEVLTLEEAAELLRVSADDVRALAESGELPARRIGETWRLTRTAVLGWLGAETPKDRPDQG
jgi:excisionase family DNA binding protein